MPHIHLTQADLIATLREDVAHHEAESASWDYREAHDIDAGYRVYCREQSDIHKRKAFAVSIAVGLASGTKSSDTWTQSWHTDTMPDAVGEFPRTVPDIAHADLVCGESIALGTSILDDVSSPRHIDCDCMDCRPWTT